jgi:hypothetical protein
VSMFASLWVPKMRQEQLQPVGTAPFRAPGAGFLPSGPLRPARSPPPVPKTAPLSLTPGEGAVRGEHDRGC